MKQEFVFKGFGEYGQYATDPKIITVEADDIDEAWDLLEMKVRNIETVEELRSGLRSTMKGWFLSL